MSTIFRSQNQPTTARPAAADDRRDAERVVEERLHVVGRDEKQEDARDRRQEAEDDAAEAAFGGQRADLGPDALTLLHGVGDRVEQRGQVSTDLALDPDRHDGPRQVVAAHAHGGVIERVLGRPAQTNLGEHALQLASHRWADLLGDCFEALHEREPGPQRAREERERVGQLAARMTVDGRAACATRRPRRDADEHGRDEAVDQPAHDGDAEEHHHDSRPPCRRSARRPEPGDRRVPMPARSSASTPALDASRLAYSTACCITAVSGPDSFAASSGSMRS